MPSKDWEETRVTISRKELGEIIATEMVSVIKAADAVGDMELKRFLKEFILEYSANIASEIFKNAPDEREA